MGLNDECSINLLCTLELFTYSDFLYFTLYHIKFTLENKMKIILKNNLIKIQNGTAMHDNPKYFFMLILIR